MIHLEQSGPVMTIILDRPEVRNAVDGPTAQALAAAFRKFEAEQTVSVAVLWGKGGHFCAGADLKALSQMGQPDHVPMRMEETGDGPMGPTRMRLSKPVIAAISGYAVAGGLELALWCDLRVVEESAVLGVFCRRFGVPLVDGGTVRLPRLIGMSRAMDLILTGRAVDAQEAMQIGLANRLVPDGQVRIEAEKLALQIANFPQACMRNDRMSAYEQWNRSEEEALKHEFHLGMNSIQSGETLSGAQRFSKGQGRHGEFDG